MTSISLDSAIALTGRSKRTWWRRIGDGTVKKVISDARGRTMLELSDVVALIPLVVDGEDLGVILRADAGDADAQADVGQMFFVAGEHKTALYWLQVAADQGHADAMQWLGHIYAAGTGVPRNENIGIMWLAKAAAHGNTIADKQIKAIMVGLGSPAAGR